MRARIDGVEPPGVYFQLAAAEGRDRVLDHGLVGRISTSQCNAETLPFADDSFDCVCVNFVTPFFVDNESIAREIVEVSQQQIKPIVCNLMTDKRQWTETVKILKEGGVPCFALPGEAARAMSAMVRYHGHEHSWAGCCPRPVTWRIGGPGSRI